MDATKRCHNCQAPLAADAPQGLCPACLVKVAMASGTIAGEEPPGFTPPSLEELARKFPQLEIIGLIGRGGMGAVYQARQKELDRMVALKILPPGLVGTPRLPNGSPAKPRPWPSSTTPALLPSMTLAGRRGCISSSWNWWTE